MNLSLSGTCSHDAGTSIAPHTVTFFQNILATQAPTAIQNVMAWLTAAQPMR